MNTKYLVSDSMKQLFQESKIEPCASINRHRGTSVAYYEYLISEVEQTLKEFESEVGLNCASAWKGVRLRECNPGQSLDMTASSLLMRTYMGHFDRDNSFAIFPLEDYRIWEENDGALYYHSCTKPSILITRPLYIDAGKHLEELELRDLLQKTEKIVDELKDEFPLVETVEAAYNYVYKAYMSFADIIVSYALMYFEAKMYAREPSLTAAFNTIIELPPDELIKNILAKYDSSISYKLNTYIDLCDRDSFIETNLHYLDLKRLSDECLQNTRRIVNSMKKAKDILCNLCEHSFDAYIESLDEFMELQTLTGILSPLAFAEEHIVRKSRN